MPSKKRSIPSVVTRGETDVRSRLEVIDLVEPHAVLATAGEDGPHTSLVAYALTPDCSGILFATPRATRKFRNLARNPSVSILIDTRTNTSHDYMGAESISAAGRARPLRKSRKREELARVFLGKHPKLRKFLASTSTVLVLVEIAECLHVSEFQKVSVWKVQ